VVGWSESGEKSKDGISLNCNQLGKFGGGLFFKPLRASCGL